MKKLNTDVLLANLQKDPSTAAIMLRKCADYDRWAAANYDCAYSLEKQTGLDPLDKARTVLQFRKTARDWEDLALLTRACVAKVACN